MAGSVLGPDQVKKVNATFPRLVAHLKSQLEKDQTAVGLMRIHCMVESFDTDEMAAIFRELSFISPKEKLALVRAGLYELMVTDPALFKAPAPVIEAPRVVKQEAPAPSAVFQPRQFNLNVNTAEKFHGERQPDIDVKNPQVVVPHTSKAAEMLKHGDEQIKEHSAKLEEAVAKLRAAAEPEAVPEVTPAIVDEVAEVETDESNE